MNNFGGDWTAQKIQILEKYTKAYLTIMKDRQYWKLVYFDGFAGAGEILMGNEDASYSISGAAKRILSIENHRNFDIYYFVELDSRKADNLKNELSRYPQKKYVVSDDCNRKLSGLANFLATKQKENDVHKALVFLDPFGMSLKWSSIESLKGLGVDIWILVPTGVGANRLLTLNGQIPDAWYSKLETFFGIERSLIKNTFYESNSTTNLFGDIEKKDVKNNNSVKKIIELYTSRLKEVFEHVSTPYEMRNSTNSVMYHFVLASNNKVAVKIANEVIKSLNG